MLSGSRQTFYDCPPPNLQHFTTTTMSGDSPLEREPRIFIDPRLSPLHEFLHNFLEESMRQIHAIGKMYSKNAVFSLTCNSENGQIGHPMGPLQKNSRNLLLSNDNAFVGCQEVVKIQRSLFPHGFLAHVTDFTGRQISNALHSIVLHGYFQDSLGIDHKFIRSMLVGAMSSGIKITNDHIFVVT